MQSLEFHLNKLATVNEMILEELQNEFAIKNLQDAFSKRDEHIEKMEQIISGVDKSTITDREHKSLRVLYDRVLEQGHKIQNKLDTKTNEMQQKLGDAIKRRKAEEKYQILK